MLFGRWNHTLTVDSKGRLALPLTVRQGNLNADGSSEYLIGRLPGARNLLLVPIKESEAFYRGYESREGESGEASERTTATLAMFSPVTADKQGRIVIPERLRRAVDLSDGVALFGRGERVEIWSDPVLDLIFEAADRAASKAPPVECDVATGAPRESERAPRPLAAPAAEVVSSKSFKGVTRGTRGPESEE